jgi:hypothetical protein
MFAPFIAQNNTVGQALDTLSNAIEVSQKTVESWNLLWFNTFNTQESSLWIALVNLGLILAGMSVLHLAVTSGKEIIERQSWSELIAMMIWPIVIVFFLSNNGKMLSESIKFIRGIGYNQVQQILEIQLGEMTFRSALGDVNLTSAAKEEIEKLYSECQGKVGEALVDCWNDKKEAAQAILNEAEQQNGGRLQSLQRFVQNLANVTNLEDIASGDFAGQVFRSTVLPIIRLILRAVQWAFVNILEAALLLTALFAPIAMGLSLLPLQGKPIWAWLVGFMSLFGVQLGYNIVVGLVAVVIVNSNAELVTDIAFLFFLAVFAPVLAVLIARGGGTALYNAIANNTKQLTDILSNAIGVMAGKLI